jgi:hypothetical protein
MRPGFAEYGRAAGGRTTSAVASAAVARVPRAAAR